MEIRYPGMVDEGKLTQTPLGRALERRRAEITPKKFANLTKAKVCNALFRVHVKCWAASQLPAPHSLIHRRSTRFCRSRKSSRRTPLTIQC